MKGKNTPREPRFHGQTTEKNSRTMSKIRGKDTKIELVLRKSLWAKGYRYRKNCKTLPGSPDIAITKYKIAIFCDGEFFHGKEWNVLRPRIEKGKNADYWVKKIERNRERDAEKDAELLFQGWTVIHFWGKDILNDTETCIKVVEEAIFDIKTEDDTDTI
ncbi:very short patch repair endonuclease [Butyrivibrio sp. AE3009]|uniref:very short patch repair endonuclease n=1 Tax=Butyrivibrio sp. AE3009 TaxID=1280666 RepID=UPI0003B3A2FD|nr:very short patch repair endonuclease [Butyrivibrio sp. AE3009]